MNHTKLIQDRVLQLERKCDASLFSVYRDENGQWVRQDGGEATVDDFKSVGGAVKTAGAIGAGLGVAAGVGALTKRYGATPIGGVGNMVKTVASGVGRDASAGAGTVAKKALTPVAAGLGGLAARSQRASSVLADSAKKDRGLGKTLGLLRKAYTRGFAVKDRLIELGAKCDEVLAPK